LVLELFCCFCFLFLHSFFFLLVLSNGCTDTDVAARINGNILRKHIHYIVENPMHRNLIHSGRLADFFCSVPSPYSGALRCISSLRIALVGRKFFCLTLTHGSLCWRYYNLHGYIFSLIPSKRIHSLGCCGNHTAVATTHWFLVQILQLIVCLVQ
jgi:hypothetical protein